jgi:hypothetical protein
LIRFAITGISDVGFLPMPLLTPTLQKLELQPQGNKGVDPADILSPFTNAVQF